MKFIVALLAALAVTAGGRAQMADLILENAVIYTLDEKQPKATALAVKDGRILALGGDLSELSGPSTRHIDAGGLTVTPGFIDSHGHMQGLGALLAGLDLRDTQSVAAVAELVRQAAAKLPTGAWVVGRNWDQSNWGGRYPTADDLSKAAPEQPVYLTRVDGHAGWANRKAMQLAGLTRETADPPGGKIVRDAEGNPTGILIDRAQSIVLSKIPPPTYQEIVGMLERAARDCARVGLTSVDDAGISSQDLRAYRELIAAGKLPVRVYAMIGGPGELWSQFLAKGPEIGDRLTVRSIKLFADGALGSRGALLWQGYSDDPGNTGLSITSEAEIARVAKQAAAAGFQVCTHAIGDRANRNVLDAYAEALGGENDKRFRIEHAQVVSLSDFALFKKYSIIASMQPTHATSDMRWAEAAARARPPGRRLRLAAVSAPGHGGGQRLGLSGGRPEPAVGILRGGYPQGPQRPTAGRLDARPANDPRPGPSQLDPQRSLRRLRRRPERVALARKAGGFRAALERHHDRARRRYSEDEGGADGARRRNRA